LGDGRLALLGHFRLRVGFSAYCPNNTFSHAHGRDIFDTISDPGVTPGGVCDFLIRVYVNHFQRNALKLTPRIRLIAGQNPASFFERACFPRRVVDPFQNWAYARGFDQSQFKNSNGGPRNE
jgi:hypothetical protein